MALSFDHVVRDMRVQDGSFEHLDANKTVTEDRCQPRRVSTRAEWRARGQQTRPTEQPLASAAPYGRNLLDLGHLPSKVNVREGC